MPMVLSMFLQKIKELAKNKKFKFKLQVVLQMKKLIEWLKMLKQIKKPIKRKEKR
jgi:hypothetical protein